MLPIIAPCQRIRPVQPAGVERNRSGVLSAMAAFFLWGVFPLFWKQLDFLSPASIVAHRTLWSLVILLAILFFKHEASGLWRDFRKPRLVAWQLMSGTLLAANWLIYVWATLNDRILEGALGYYLNPFLNMLFGFLWFGDRHNRLQLTAIALALCGVALQLPAAGTFPWVAVVLATTFALYAVVKKLSPVDSRIGLTMETILMAPVALGWLMFHSSSPSQAFGGTAPHAMLVIASGIATILPLIFFGHAARIISLTTLGILQFLGPTLQFLIGWRFYGEPVTPGRLLTFGLIWTAVAIYATDAIMREKKARLSGKIPQNLRDAESGS